MISLSAFDKNDDSIHIQDEGWKFLSDKNPMFVGDFMSEIKTALTNSGFRVLREDEGLQCRVMIRNQDDWHDGKIILKSQFIPDGNLQIKERKAMNEELLMSLIGKAKKMVETLYSEEAVIEKISSDGDKIIFNVDTDNRSKVFVFNTTGDLISLDDWEK